MRVGIYILLWCSVLVRMSGQAQYDNTDWLEYEKFEYSSEHWEPHYDFDSKEPYGGFILQEMLATDFNYEYFFMPLEEYLSERWYYSEPQVLFSYSYDLHYRYRDVRALKNFVNSGNDAVIICEELPSIMESYFFQPVWDTNEGDTLLANFREQDGTVVYYRPSYVSNYKSYDYSWKGIVEDSQNDTLNLETIVTGFGGTASLVKMPYGKGNFYFCSVPMLFSNYYLKQEDGQRLYKAFFSRFNNDNTFLFDMSSIYPHTIFYHPSYIGMLKRMDSDRDGLSDYYEQEKDTDGDGISDAQESNGKDRDNDGLRDHEDTDSDNDGLSDSEEGDKDTDGDGVKDRYESNTEDEDGDGKPNHEDTDSDGDGIEDGEEDKEQDQGSTSSSRSHEDEFKTEEEKALPEESPLGHVLGDRALMWAYILLVLLGVLYVIYKGKRKQKVIPLVEQDKNSSKEFVETISGLYLSKRQHRNLVVQKYKNFMHFIRNKYHISKKESDPGFFETLEAKSGVNPEIIQKIFKGFKQADSNKTVSGKELGELHNTIEQFYKNCK